MESYYTDAVTDGEPPGAWSGRLGEQHGLVGEVTELDLARLLKDFETPDGTRLGSVPRAYRSVDKRVADYIGANATALPEEVDAARARAENEVRSAKVAYDLTLSVPKSVSAAHTAVWRAELEADRSGDLDRADAFRTVRTGIEDAVHTANTAAMDHVADLVHTRAGAHGRAGTAGRWVPAPDLVIASFLQHTSRSIDPQLHIHNVLFARAQDAEGQVRAIDSADLRDQRKAYSAISERVLAEEMSRIGLRMELRPDGISREVVGVPEAVCELFSSRRQVISAQLTPAVAAAEERLGRTLTPLETSRLAQRVTLFTRAAKTHDGETFEQMLDRWQADVRAEVGAGLVPLAQRLLQAHQRATTPDATGATAGDIAGSGTGGTFSPDAVIAQAVQACAQQSAAWGRAELMLELDHALPVIGMSPTESRDLLSCLADRALLAQDVVQVAGRDVHPAPQDLVGLGVSYVRPSARKWAAPITLQAEDLIRRAAITRGAYALDRDHVATWLGENYPTLTPEQRAVVQGLAASDAQLVQVVAAAGTGKSFTSGALAGAWDALSDGGRVQGLTVSEVAAQVLRGDGVAVSRNLAAWLAAQDRLAAGRGLPLDAEVAVRAHDVLLVDEASMVATAQLDRVRAAAAAAGARVVLVGDPQQLSAVEAGGALSLLDGHAETYTLSEVRRFTEPWEGVASLQLREGGKAADAALREYERRGRIIDAPTVEDAVRDAARRTAADLLEGREAIAVAGSNDLAARLATAIRDELVAVGRIPAEGIHLPLDGTTAAVGDRVMTRQIDRGLGVLNRQRWTVADLLDDGGLRIVNTDGEVRDLPARYVEQHVQSGYAGTGHAVQGVTVDRAVSVHDGSGDLASVYVPATRGRDRNTLIVALAPDRPADAAGAALVDGTAVSGRSVLHGMLDRQVDNLAARVQAERDDVWNASLSTLAGKLEDVTHIATLQRLNGDLDQLVADGVLDQDDRNLLAADPSTEHLARVVRAAEQAGHDAFDVLREACTSRELDTATSVAQVLATRIERDGALIADDEAPTRGAPARLPATWQAHYDALQEAVRDRTRELGTTAAQQPPAWATSTLGPVPDDAVARLEWETRAGAIAAYREATGWEHADRPLRGPGARTDTEKHALYLEAWDALGRPAASRDEAELSDGSLRARVAAWEREQTWAPPVADASLRQAERDADELRTEATLARAGGDADRADELDARAETRAAVARTMDAVADARGAWLQTIPATRALGEAAAEELARRGLPPNAEDDRVSAEEWLAAEKAARAEDDAHRPITEADLAVDDRADQDSARHSVVEVDLARNDPPANDPRAEVPDQGVPEAAAADESAQAHSDRGEVHEEERREQAPTASHAHAPLTPTDVEQAALLTAAGRAVDLVANRAAEEAAHAEGRHALTEHDLVDLRPHDAHLAEGYGAPSAGGRDAASVPVAE